MLILDTNVLSEWSRGTAEMSAPVLAWVRHLEERPSTTAICAAELAAGLATLPAGERRERLTYSNQLVLAELGPMLPFDHTCVDAYAAVTEVRTRMGRPMSAPGAQIAAIALVNGAILATRNTKDFDGLGIELVNPWE